MTVAAMVVVTVVVTIMVMIMVVVFVLLVESILKLLDDVLLNQGGVDGGCRVIPRVLGIGEDLLSNIVLGNG